MSDNDAGMPAARAGLTISLGPGSHLTLKAVGTDTDGAFALMEYVLAPGGGAGLHSHSREDASSGGPVPRAAPLEPLPRRHRNRGASSA